MTTVDAAGSLPDTTVGPRLVGLHYVCLPVVDVDRTADWFAEVLGFEPCVTFEEEDRVTGALLEHSSGTAVILRADATRAFALSGFPVLALAVADRPALEDWDEHLTRLGVDHLGVAIAHLGWEIRLWGPDMVEILLTTAGVLDGAVDNAAPHSADPQ